MTQYVDFEKVGADVQAAARKIREAEQSLRNAAAALGRSPQALAFNALATDAWKLGAGILAVINDFHPVE